MFFLTVSIVAQRKFLFQMLFMCPAQLSTSQDSTYLSLIDSTSCT